MFATLTNLRILDRVAHSKAIASMVRYFGRGAECLTSFNMVIIAMIFAANGNSLAGPMYMGFATLGITEVKIAVPMAIIGSMRVAALFVNGAIRQTPMVRLVGAFIGGALYCQLVALYSWPSLVDGQPLSISVGTYSVLALFEFLACITAAIDVRKPAHR